MLGCLLIFTNNILNSEPLTHPCPIFSKRVYFFFGSPTLTMVPGSKKQNRLKSKHIHYLFTNVNRKDKESLWGGEKTKIRLVTRHWTLCAVNFIKTLNLNGSEGHVTFHSILILLYVHHTVDKRGMLTGVKEREEEWQEMERRYEDWIRSEKKEEQTEGCFLKVFWIHIRTDCDVTTEPQETGRWRERRRPIRGEDWT